MMNGGRMMNGGTNEEWGMDDEPRPQQTTMNDDNDEHAHA